MVQLRSDGNWLNRGKQKLAVAQVLRRPMTPSEIWRAAQPLSPRIRLRDVWFILRQMKERGLVTCFNPKELTGKIHYWSGTRASEAPSINWRSYAHVVRARVRRVVLVNLAHTAGQSASRIRRSLHEGQMVGLNSVIRALRDLRSLRLIKIVGEGSKRGQKLYRLTRSGSRIAHLLMEADFRTDSPQRLLNSPATSSA